MQAGLHLEHEFVEVDAALLRHRRIGKEQVHQHGLAATDRAPDVEAVRPLRRFGRVTEAEARQESRLGRRGAGHRRELVMDRLQSQNDFFLHGIGVDLAGGAARSEVGERALAGRGGTGFHCGGIPSSPPRGCL